jgi:hypothetical protein
MNMILKSDLSSAFVCYVQKDLQTAASTAPS